MNLSMYAYFSSMIRHRGVAAAIDFAHTHGFSSVEFLEMPSPDKALSVPSTDAARQIKAQLDKNDLSVSCYSVGLTVLDPSTGLPITQNLEELSRLAEIASALGSPYFHHTLILNVSPTLHKSYLPFEKLLDRLIEVALPIAQKATALGMTTLYEPQGFYVNGIDQFGVFYERMKAMGVKVGVCGDIGNSLFVDVDPTDFFRAFAKEIRHIHLKDYRQSPNAQPDETQSISGTRLEQVLLGEGVVDFQACLDILKEVGYDGTYALEGSYTSDVEESFAKEIATVRKLFGDT